MEVAQESRTPNELVVTVDSKEYTINTTQMPYFITHESPNHTALRHFDVAVRCLEEGFHVAFDAFQSDFSSYPILCSTLERLGVDVLDGCTLVEINNGFKNLESQVEGARMENTNLAAADSVFELVYIQHKGALWFQDRKRFFDAVLYIVSHHDFFNHITRAVAAHTFKKMAPSARQLVTLDKWPIYDSDGGEVETAVYTHDYVRADFYSEDLEGKGYCRVWGQC